MEGIQQPSTIWRYGGSDPGRGMTFRNVTLSGFDKELDGYDCRSSAAIALASDKYDGHFDYVSSVAGSSIVDARNLIVDGCRAADERGVKDLVYTDVDGSLSGQSAGGALVSNFPHVTDILGGACSDMGNCMAYCRGMCLRTMSFKVEQFGTENWKEFGFSKKPKREKSTAKT